VSASGRYRSAPPSLSGEFEAAVPPPPEAIPLIRESPRPPPPEVPSGVTPLARAVDLVFPPTTEVEAKFLDALARGSVEAGKELILQLENRQDRAHDLLATCRRVAALVPGDRWTIRKLYEAAAADRDTVYARAIDHVLSVFDPRRAPTDPPPLSEQAEQPEWVRAMLFRDVTGPAAEALALVWEGAERVFRRDPGSYGVTGLERVPPGAPSPIGRVYGTAVRLLGVGRTPLFQRRSAGAVTLSVALLAPPALILSGEVYEESRELGFHVGAMLAATLPQYVLLFGSPESQARAVLRALALAFGPPKHEAMQLAGVANLAEVLWESIPARSQRRLRELCDEPSVLNYDRALGEAQRAVRRAGLFVAGDLSVALRETCLDEGIAPEALDEPDGLSALCSSSPSISDLVRLATSPEYAETRWQPARSGNRHPSDNWATF